MIKPLHKAEHPWKPVKVADANDERFLLQKVRAILNKITPSNYGVLSKAFLKLNVYKSPALEQIVSIIFTKAVDEPNFSGLYAKLCKAEVQNELAIFHNVSNFRNAILGCAQVLFATKEENVAARQADREHLIRMEIEQFRFKKRKHENSRFIAHLYLNNIISVRIIIFCIHDLLKTVTEKPVSLNGYKADDDSVECAITMLEILGRRLKEHNDEEIAAKETIQPQILELRQTLEQIEGMEEYADFTEHIVAEIAQLERNGRAQLFPLDGAFTTLEDAKQFVSSRIRFKIIELEKLRRRDWKVVEKQPDPVLDDIKSQIKAEQVAIVYRQNHPNYCVAGQVASGERADAVGHAPASVERGEPNQEIQDENLPNDLDNDPRVQYWKEKFEESERKREDMERKYRKLLMKLGRGQPADN